MLRTFLLGLIAIVTTAAAAMAGDAVRIETADGRELHGAVDARSDDDHLWVRREEGSIVLATPVAWSEIASATIGSVPIDAAELRRRRSETATAGPRWFADKTMPAVSLGVVHARPPVERSAWGQGGHVRSIEVVEAYLVNLDRDVEADGLVVSIAALDERGTPMAVRGSLRARLYVEQVPANIGELEIFTGDRWTQPVAARDFIDGVATYELRFRHTAPEWQFNLMPNAVLDVQLGAHGEGNFAASAPVRIREINPLRDDRQMFYETRFFPGELHGRDPRSGPRPGSNLWQDRTP